MTLAARHLEPRRPRKDRDVTWSRTRGHDGGIIWTFWRRDYRRALHMLTVDFSVQHIGIMPEHWTAQRIKDGKRKLRDFVDEIDLAAMANVGGNPRERSAAK
ncbi:MAG TPA: hypothetical protein VFN69_04475 [Rudaea sp.]|nr:hypothetical protein [Rudaea sp.]